MEDDYENPMQPLDGTFPAGKTNVGGPRGSCGADTVDSSDVEEASPVFHIILSNLKFYELGSTSDDTPIKPRSTQPGRLGPVPAISKKEVSMLAWIFAQLLHQMSRRNASKYVTRNAHLFKIKTTMLVFCQNKNLIII